MAVPKHKKSKSRTHRQRRVNMKLTLPQMIKCPQCGELTPPHKVCVHCGYYKNKPIETQEVK